MDDYFVGSARPAQPPASYPHAQSWPQAPAWPGQPPPAYYPPPAPGMSTGAKVAIGLAIGVGAFIVIGVLAAIAIPVFLDQRAKDVSNRTSVSLPESIGGMARLTDATSLQVERQLRSLPLAGDHLAGMYGDGTTRVAVGVTKRYMSPAEQRGFLAGAERGARDSDGTGATFARTNAGSLGGQMRCGTLAVGVTTCFFADFGVYGTVLVFGAPGDPTDLARTARLAVEHRA